MRRHKKLLILIAVLVSAVSLFFVFHRKPEPIYRGYSLSYWAERYAKAYFNQRAFLSPKAGYAGVESEAEEAIRGIGTNALPFVRKWLHFEQPHFTVRLFYSLRLNRLPQLFRDPIHKLAFQELDQRHAQHACYILQVLGTEASPVAPDLLQLCGNRAEPDTAYRCLTALGTLGTNALPELMQVVRDANHPYRGAAVIQLEEVLRKSSPSSIPFPVLLQCLGDTDSSLASLACFLLGRAGWSQAAAPFLQTNLLSSDPAVRMEASNALFAIPSATGTDSSPARFGR